MTLVDIVNAVVSRSSAYSAHGMWEDSWSHMSSMKIMKRVGEMTPPCGTPSLIFTEVTLSVAYPSTTCTRAYTDWSAEEAAKNGRGGVFIKLPNGRSIRKSVATGQQSTNYRAKAYTLLAAAQTLNQEERLPTNTVFDWLPVHPAKYSITQTGSDLQQH